MQRRTINPAHRTQRTGLRAIGAVLAIGGGILAAIGLVSFFSAFGGGGTPSLFWCAFLGLPMLGIGLQLLRAGYIGTIARYVAGETAPVAADTLDYLADEAAPAVQSVAASLRAGLQTPTGAACRPCRQCQHGNDADARFCEQCGTPLQQPQRCPKCRAENQADARFCDACGERLQPA